MTTLDGFRLLHKGHPDFGNPDEWSGKTPGPGYLPYGGLHVPLSRKATHSLLASGHYSIISAGKNSEKDDEKDLPHDHPKFQQRHKELKADLDKHGVHHTEVDGHWGEPEGSFLVYHGGAQAKAQGGKVKSFITPHKHVSEHELIRQLAAKHGQAAVIHSKDGNQECHYVTGDHAGTHHKGYGHEPLAVSQESDFTRVPHLGGSATKFALNFDWDTYHPHTKATLKSLRMAGHIVMTTRSFGGLSSLRKAGERGGQVIGTSPSGRPIYRKRYEDPKGWKKQHQAWSAEDHAAAADLHEKEASQSAPAGDDRKHHKEQSKRHRQAAQERRGRTGEGKGGHGKGRAGKQARKRRGAPGSASKRQQAAKDQSYYEDDKGQGAVSEKTPQSAAAAGQAAGAALGGNSPTEAAIGLGGRAATKMVGGAAYAVLPKGK